MKNLHICFSNFKYCLPTIAPPPQSSPNSHHHHHRRRRRPSPSSFFIKNFNSLYDLSSSDNHLIMTSTTTTATATTTTTVTTAPTDSSDPDFSAVFASKRFFVSSPGESNSIIDSLPNSPTKSGNHNNNNMVAGGVAIQTYSPDPYEDFRRSMQEMFEAHKSSSLSYDDDWDYLKELLHCYLSLNPKRNHKFIVRAFSDLVASLVLIN
ncbi:transcription repressor OFP16 [Impatiens glandulifera]|uniref:transcription repressor OFP16 n=1 Tax=Impatiens glandulifera TaxID=253017 RepID=UPI001FB056CB|nr:transcription repressor OFP16 [Impatiens glandulifera]